MRGDDILLVQQRLLTLGYSEVGRADGVFGPLTDQAVRRFQQLNGQEVDGRQLNVAEARPPKPRGRDRRGTDRRRW